MKNSLFRKLCAGFLSLALGAQVLLSGGVALAGQQLGQQDFEEGAGLPWHIVESATGKMDFEIDNGVYKITIINPGGASNGGEDRWDCQFRHRGLKIVAGHQYQVSYEITASNSGKYYTKIGNLEGTDEVWHNMSNGYDLDSHWDPLPISANETKKVNLTFTAGHTVEVAEWAFHLGGDGQYTNGVCFPAGTVITFDNMSLVDLTSDENDYKAPEKWVRSDVLTNQLGYFTDAAKQATLLFDSDDSIGFGVYDEDGNEVFQGESKPFGKDKDSGDYVQILDFSELGKTGTFTIETEDGQTSRPFKIGNTDDYSAMLFDGLNYFYQNRSGVKIEARFITSGDPEKLARDAGHPNDTAEIEQTWGYSASSGSQDVTGGWYDAGDHGKYVVNGGISLWTMQNQYELALKNGTEKTYADGTMNIPENNNGYPDLLDEARFEMEWMFKMLVKDGDCKDMVYHKVHDEKWTGLGLAPADDTQKRIIKPPTTAATLNVSACAAQAARLWKGIDDDFAEECLDIAKRTYEAAKKHPEMYAPLDESIGGGAYGDDDVTDEFYWAACELYLSTGDDDYLDDCKDSKHYLSVPTTLSGGESVGTEGCTDWGHTQALGTFSLLLHEKDIDSDIYKKALENLKDTADYYLEVEENQGYSQPYKASKIAYNDSDEGYVWGSNSFVLNNALMLAYAYELSDDEKYLNGAIAGLDYLLGRNPMDYSYVTGYGSHTTTYPHHRYWAKQIDDSFPLAPCGVLSGGPNSGMQDPWVQGAGWKKGKISPAKCYLDNIEAWSVNECTINWNAPLCWLTAYLTEQTDEGIKVGATGNGNGITISEDTKKNPNEGSHGDTDEVDEDFSESGSSASPSNDKDSSGKSEKTSKDSTKNSSDKASDKSESSEKGGRDYTLLIIILVAVLVVLISAEIFIFKILKLKAESNKQPDKKQDDKADDGSKNE
ncbi:MAG: glycoside hydrolase family 9 protein [Lachnospiraceae bacterium]|nr:glycoside hydrolase family 9 protein [Lachnospiraceae bacterium]